MATERRKQQKTFPSPSVPPPPQTLNVRKFAESRVPELESLHSVISNRLSNNFKSQQNKRRRTTGFNRRNLSRKRQKLSDKNENQNSNKLRLPRRVRRRIELRKNPKSGFLTSGDGTKRLPTHLWHTKRFSMAKKWGFFLPLGLPGRGRGSRALLKCFKHETLLHDASYNSAVQLEGPEDSLLSILRRVLVPTPTVHLEQLSTSTHSGSTFGSAMLHHVGAPFSELISPVTYMWRPFIRCNFDSGAESNHMQRVNMWRPFIRCNFDPGAESNHMTSESISPSSSLSSSSFRQLWVWIHAGSLIEGLGALRLACQQQGDETGISVNCFSREGQLAKLELMGSKAIKTLQKILNPVSRILGSSLESMRSSVVEAKTYPQLQRSFILEHAVHLPDHAILSLMVKDPRDLPKKESKSVSEAASNSLDSEVVNDESNDHSALTECPDQNIKIISSLLNSEANSVLYSDSKDLWENHNGVNPPVEENLLCMEKHQKRMDFFNLYEKSGMPTTETKEQYSRSCPVLLLKKHNLRGSCFRWAIILPLSWVKAFWLPLVNHGARAIGLRERRWVACDVGWPCFPFDFPDCKTYSCFMASEAVASDEKMELRPLAMRPLKVPIPPPWDSIRLTFEVQCPSVGDIQDVHEENSRRVSNGCDSLDDAGTAHCESEILDQDDSSFRGIIARTSRILNSHLNEIHGGHLLLFPNEQMGKQTKIVENRDKIVPSPGGDSHLPFDRKLCFLRVFLRAYKEGSFEEGSVVCAPHLTDILLWTSRSDVQEGRLQIPQSLIASYYTLQASEKWELQKPEDPVTRESHRWPIGFVTTGFVRGSTKPTAEAFCEATLLAQLRREQWEGKQRKPEIFVLVRNLRSSAYRLALATIVLEQQTEDVEFI